MTFRETGRRLARNELWRDIGLLVLRVGFAVVVIWRHGYPHLLGLMNTPDQFFDPIGLGATTSLVLATFAEFLCAGLLALGWLSRWCCLILTVNFVVIVFVLHELGVPGDRGELALLYLIAFATLFFTGPGRFSLDQRLGRVGSSAD
jgi:putative oxidoreductase